jgi:putative ABC transport system permease protein
MILNYFKIAWRNMMKSKVFSLINIFGLAAGLACCMLISVYLLYELSYDKDQPEARNTYQIATEFTGMGRQFTLAATPEPMAAALVKDFPEVTAATRLLSMSLFEDKVMLRYLVPHGQPEAFYVDKGFMADSNFFSFFLYPFVEGDPATALRSPATMVISEEIAHKLFGSSPAIGKVIRVGSGVNGDHNFTVTGVFGAPENPSHIVANFFISFTGGDFEQFMKRQENDFTTNNMFNTYLRLRKDASPATIEARFPAFLDKYAGRDMQTAGIHKREFLVAVPEIHLRSDVPGNVTPPVSRTSLYILASIAAFTLLIACINFMNLATARSARRSAEVGVRKVLGAVKGSLIGQFLGESVLMSALAFGFAWSATLLLLPAFSNLTGRHLSLDLPKHLPLLTGFFGLAVFAGLMAGVYPAFYLSSFEPAKVLKGRFSNSLAAVSLRKGLVVFQFMISVILIVSTVVINDQMTFMRSQDLGFDKTAQIVIPLRGTEGKRLSTDLENEFRRIDQVTATGAALYYPGLINPSDNLFYRDGHSSAEGLDTRMNFVDYGYMPALGIKPVAGRVFSKEFPDDTSGRIVLNESAVKALGFASPTAAIGNKVKSTFQGNVSTYEVIGVVRDFHFEDLHLPITPYAFQLTRGGENYLIIHSRPGTPGPLLASLGAAWKRVNPNEPFEYSFLDEDFQKNYVAEERLSTLVRYFTVMAILISCLGLFGLASFSAEQRVREIGIRKVLGASVSGIVLLLSRDFLLLVSVAMVIATVPAWLIMHRWLQDFAYRTSISWTVFAITFGTTMLITLATISFQAVRAAISNPVRSLKTE